MLVREIIAEQITEKIIEAIGKISFSPDGAVEGKLKQSLDNEESEIAKDVLATLIENLTCAKEDAIPLCQDTGTLVVFAEIGSDVHIAGGCITEIINHALRTASAKYYLRASIVCDPLFNRTNTNDNAPAVIHTRIVSGDKLTLKLAQKGGGAENMSQLRMFTPSATREDLIQFVLNTIITSGSKACPPLVVGMGIGGNFESCAVLAKEALLRPLEAKNNDSNYAALEAELLSKINQTGIGAQGMGGITTALAVHIKQAPCHIASLPVAVNLQCHAHRHIEIVI